MNVRNYITCAFQIETLSVLRMREKAISGMISEHKSDVEREKMKVKITYSI